jgi:hypothetical protein
LSLPAKLKLAALLVVGSAGLSVSVVSGAIVSGTVQLWRAGVSSTLPARSIARTSNVCGPAARLYDFGLTQAAKASPSTRHS